MSWVSITGGLFCAWAVLRLLGGERERRLRELADEAAAEKAKEEELKRSQSAGPVASGTLAR